MLITTISAPQATLPWSSCPTDGPNNTINLECAQSSETAFFWYRHTLDVSPSIEEPEGIKWWMALCLLLSWVVVYICIRKGIKSSGKVSSGREIEDKGEGLSGGREEEGKENEWEE